MCSSDLGALTEVLFVPAVEDLEVAWFVTVVIDASFEISDKVDVVVLEDDDMVTFGFGLLRLLLLQLLLLCPSLSLE